ncbi:MAG TPA: MFS transporter [Burkholderiales bacterium]|nr:MFS transporter [Burkholderiales bacterium]
MLKQTLAIGLTQTVAWASSTYLPAILAVPIAKDLGIAPATVFGAFSVSLVVMALAGPPVGRAIDRHGGRGLLAISNLVLALGLVLLAASPGSLMLFGAWGVLGLGMALGLYDAAFATLVRLHGADARLPITGITLIAGFASTVGWPLTAYLAAHGGWRTACVAWAAIHIVIALPINLLFVPATGAPPEPRRAMPSSEERKAQTAAMPLLIAFAATTAFVTSAMAAHLPGLLVAMGASGVVAIGAASLLGPAQVFARIVEIAAARRYRVHPLVPARVATALHPVACLVLAAFGGGAAPAIAYALLHGAGNGLITIVRGTLPLALFGQAGYGERQGVIAVLARAMQAAAPFSYAWVLYNVGPGAAIGLTAALSLAALGTLLALRPSADP